MYSFQNELPSLPVPELSKTLELYLRNLKPLVNESQFSKTEKIANKFLENEGSILQKKLLEYSQSIKPKSWLMPYSRDIYLNMRGPVTIEGNYLNVIAPLELSEEYDYLDFVSIMVHCAGLLYIDVLNETLPTMKAKDTPMCMKQFEGFFRGMKVPCKNKDEFIIHKDVEEVNSFGVFYKNKYYAIRIIDDNSQVIGCDEIRNALAKIYENNESLEVNFNTSAFGGSEVAYELIHEMCKDETNKKNFEIVNKTMFNVSLTNLNSTQISIKDKLYNDTDLWPYKAWSITVYRDKIISLNNEHTYMDGVTSMYAMQQMIEKMKNFNFKFSNTEKEAELTHVNFNLTNELKEKLIKIKKEYTSKINEFSCMEYKRENIPTKKLKENKINVDSFFQFSYQYAQLKSFGEMKTTHESVSAAQYYEGRTSCIRSVSEQSADFVKALYENKPPKQLIELAKKASQEHMSKIENAKNFNCFIRHAAGLNIMYEMFGRELGIDKKPEVFSDVSFFNYCTQYLSTSTVGNTWFVDVFAFSPQTEGGLGIGYITHGDTFIMDMMFYKNKAEVANTFKDSMDEYFDKMEKVLSSL